MIFGILFSGMFVFISTEMKQPLIMNQADISDKSPGRYSSLLEPPIFLRWHYVGKALGQCWTWSVVGLCQFISSQ